MRLCANENIPRECVERLRSAGHDVLWIQELAAGASDISVLQFAQKEGRILLTCDKDFGELVYRQGKSASAGIVLIRISSSNPSEFSARVTLNLEARTDWDGHFSVIDDLNIRMRPLV